MNQLFTLLCCLIGFSGFCQSIDVAYSEPLNAEEKDDCTVIQCPNGNTLLLNFSGKDGAMVDVYDASHKIIAHEVSTVDAWSTDRTSKTSLNGTYVIGGDVVVFIRTRAEEPILHRVIFSGTTGKKISEERTAVIEPEGLPARRASKYADVASFFAISKDPASDAYAIVYHYRADFDGAPKPTLIHYNGQHKEIGRSLITAPNNKYVFIDYSHMLVRGTDEVLLCTRAWNNGKDNRESSAIMLSRLRGNTVVHTVLNSWNTNRENYAWMTYNTKEGTIQLLTQVLIAGKNGANAWTGLATIASNYTVNISALDGESLAVKYSKNLDYSKATEFRRKHYDVQYAYTGFPKNIYVNNDGTVTVVMESRGSYGDVAVLDYNTAGDAVKGFAVRKGTASEAAPGTRWAGGGYYGYEYLSTPTARFVLFNDHPANFEHDADKTPKELKGISDANTACYRLQDRAMSKMYLFGQPNKDFDSRFANFSCSDFNKERATYCILLVERNGRGKQARLAWAHLK